MRMLSTIAAICAAFALHAETNAVKNTAGGSASNLVLRASAAPKGDSPAAEKPVLRKKDVSRKERAYCEAITLSGNRCKRRALPEKKFCRQHEAINSKSSR